MKIFILTVAIMGNLVAKDLLFDTKSGEYTDYNETLSSLPDRMNLILGEYHYNTPIQKAQAKIISDTVRLKQMDGNFTVGWEFLNYIDQEKIVNNFNKFKNREIEKDDLFKNLGLYANSENDKYFPIMEATKNYNGNFIGLNAPRAWKKIVMSDGLEGLEPNQVPENFELGGANYKKRFIESMGGHGGDQLDSYYLAQCYTDSVMAEQFINTSRNQLNFMIAGSFHTDFRDGAVAQLFKITNLPIITFKIVNAKEYTPEEIQELIRPHSEYGPIADFIYLLNIN